MPVLRRIESFPRRFYHTFRAYRYRFAAVKTSRVLIVNSTKAVEISGSSRHDGEISSCPLLTPFSLNAILSKTACGVKRRRLFSTLCQKDDNIQTEASKDKDVQHKSDHSARSLDAAAEAAKDIVVALDPHEKTIPQLVSEASRSILSLTSPPQPLAGVILLDKDTMSASSASLHRSLLAVTSWCISLVPKDVSLLKLALDLAQRAHDLSLPLHLPLYRNLATAVARYSSRDAASTILQVSHWATSALQSPLQPSYFSEALVALVETNKLREAIDLRLGIRDRHDMESLDIRTAMEMLVVLKERIQKSLLQQDYSSDDDIALEEADATELVMLLHDSLMKDVNRAEGTLGDTISALMEKEEEDDDERLEPFSIDDEDDEDDEDNDGDELAPYPELADMMESVRTYGENAERLKASLGDLIQRSREKKQNASRVATNPVVVAVEIDEQTGNVKHFASSRPLLPTMEDQDSDDDDQDSDGLVRDTVYLRDSTNWNLPDITMQLIRLNDGQPVYYTRDYEQQIYKRMVHEEDAEYSF